METIKRIFCCAIVGCLILAIAFFFTPLGAFAAIGFEGTLTKWKIDNPYVNGNLSGWEEVYISEVITFQIPPNWTIEYDNGIYSVVDSGGNTWAIGALFGTDTDYFDDYSAFFAETLCSEPFELSIEVCPEYMSINAASIEKITLNHLGRSQFYYIVEMHTISEHFIWILFSDLSQNADACDVVEAIMYSFTYKT